jgi:RNA polymerase-associated protein
VLTLYDAARCPYCARVRIVLAEKSISYETVAVDLDDRSRWIYDLNPSGRVPVLDDDGRVLPESRVIMEYLEDRVPEPPLLPGDPMGRARVRLLIERFGETIGDAYYAVRRDGWSPAAGEALSAALDGLDRLLAQQPYLSGPHYGLADCAYVPLASSRGSRPQGRRSDPLRAPRLARTTRRATGGRRRGVARGHDSVASVAIATTRSPRFESELGKSPEDSARLFPRPSVPPV